MGIYIALIGILLFILCDKKKKNTFMENINPADIISTIILITKLNDTAILYLSSYYLLIVVFYKTLYPHQKNIPLVGLNNIFIIIYFYILRSMLR